MTRAVYPPGDVHCLAQRHLSQTVEVHTVCECAIPAVGYGSGVTVAVPTTTGCILGASGEVGGLFALS